MTTLRNHARDRLVAGELSLGFSIRLLRSGEVAAMAKAAGYDWLFLDCEDGTLSLDSTLLSAALTVDYNGAAGLFDLQAKGLLDARQLTVAAVTLTLFIPCVAQFLIMKKERGLKVALAIALFVSLLAFSSGWLLNEFLLVTGIL